MTIPQQRTGSGMLNARESEYIRLNWEKLRRANRKASEASRLWEQRNAEFMDLARRQGWTDDPVKLAGIKKNNLLLNDAFDTWHFWQREAVRLSSLLQAEKDVRDLLERES